MIFHLMRRLRSVFQRTEPSGRFLTAAGVLVGVSLAFTILLKLAEGDRLVMVVPPDFEWPKYEERIAATRKG